MKWTRKDRKQERKRAREFHGREPERLVIHGRNWIYWTDENPARIDAYSDTDEDGIPCKHGPIYAYMGGLRGSPLETLLSIFDFYGGVQ